MNIHNAHCLHAVAILFSQRHFCICISNMSACVALPSRSIVSGLFQIRFLITSYSRLVCPSPRVCNGIDYGLTACMSLSYHLENFWISQFPYTNPCTNDVESTFSWIPGPFPLVNISEIVLIQLLFLLFFQVRENEWWCDAVIRGSMPTC